MFHIKNGFLIAVAALIITSGCVKKTEYLRKQAETDGLRQDVATAWAKNKAMHIQIGNYKKEKEGLISQLQSLKDENEKVRIEKNTLQTSLQKLGEETNRTVKELKQKNSELEGDKQMLEESIALLKKSKEKEVKNVSGTYENLLKEMETEIKKGQIVIKELKGKLTLDVLDKILFDSGKVEIKPEGKEVLNRVVDILAVTTGKEILVEGHTDNIPIAGNLSKKYPTNWELSAARAINIVRYLEEQGIDPQILAAVAFSEHRPVAENNTPEGRAKNRRITIILQSN
jgi:chemotaxis protein MotB